MNRVTALTVILLLGLFAFTVPALAASYTFVTFEYPDSLPGTTDAVGINDSGVVVGTFSDSDGKFHNFVRNADGSFSSFDCPSAWGVTCAANGINNNGEIVGSFISGNSVMGFVRSADGESFIKFNIPNSSSWDGAYGINDSGEVSGTTTTQGLGFVRSTNGKFTTFKDPFAAAGIGTEGCGINDYGDVVGYCGSAFPFEGRGFVRSAEGKFSSFYVPYSIAGQGSTQPEGINDNGQIVGQYLDRTAQLYRGFLRSADGSSFTTIDPPLDPHWDSAWGHDIFLQGINCNSQLAGFVQIYTTAPPNPTVYWMGFIATPVGFPVIDNLQASSVTTSTAMLGANIESTLGVTAVGIQYGATPTVDPTWTTKTAPYVSGDSFTETVKGRNSNTLYYFRGYVTDTASDTSYTDIGSFTTISGPPTAAAASKVGSSGFTANWKAPKGPATINDYQLDVATDSGFTAFVSGYYQNLTVLGTSAQVTGLAAGETYYYRVRAVNDGGTSANSNVKKVVLPALPTIALTSPTSGETVKAGGKCQIKWTYTGSPGSVEIDLLQDSTKVSTIISSTTVGSSGKGSYSWTIPGSEPSGSDYQIQVSSTTLSPCTATSKDFTITK